MDTVVCEVCGRCLALTVFKSGLRLKPDRHVCFECFPRWRERQTGVQVKAPAQKESWIEKIEKFTYGKAVKEMTEQEKEELRRKKAQADEEFYRTLGVKK